MPTEQEQEQFRSRRRRMVHGFYKGAAMLHYYGDAGANEEVPAEVVPEGEGIQVEGFQGLALFNQPIPDQIDISIEGFQGLALFNAPIPDQIDISLEGFQGLVIAQIIYP